ncbi:BatD family protein [Sulfurimonas sp. HSL3-7]|uniref:BatD family protein n=1 Tax=Sulfonitrofixus jiaomeiensis TaxID=3131938 RepID=UPI0031F97927
MMKSPGRLMFFLLIGTALYASVTARVDKTTVKKGEAVALILRVEGKTFSMPPMTTLCGVGIEQHAHRTVAESGEGGFQKAEIYQYRFRPESDCVIAPIAIEVDGVESYSQPIKIEVDGKGDSSIFFELQSDKKELYVGELFEVQAVFKIRALMDERNTSLIMPETEHLWIKQISETLYTKEGLYSVATTRYLMVPQQAGTLRIYPAEMKIAADYQRDDGWGNPKDERVWQSYYSNALELEVKALPADITMVGDFSMALELDADRVEAKKPLEAELLIRGTGNFEDIPAFRPTVPGVEVLSGDPRVEEKGAGRQELWRQKLTFIAEGNFTIPPITLDYFDLEERRVKRVQTQPVSIYVIDAQKSEETIEEEHALKQKGEGINMVQAVVIYLLGAASAALLFMLPWRRYVKTVPAAKKVSAADYRRVLRVLLMHKDAPDVQAMIVKLEAFLYEGKDEKIDERVLKKLLKKYS